LASGIALLKLLPKLEDDLNVAYILVDACNEEQRSPPYPVIQLAFDELEGKFAVYI
jgi:hypothetical protein